MEASISRRQAATRPAALPWPGTGSKASSSSPPSPAADGRAVRDELRPGEVVVKIDGRPAALVLADAESLISAATPQWRRHRALQQIGAGDPGSDLVLELKAGARPRARSA